MMKTVRRRSSRGIGKRGGYRAEGGEGDHESDAGDCQLGDREDLEGG